MSNKINKTKYFVIYTAIFFAMFLFMTFNYAIDGRTFIYGPDGFSQHYKSLVYFSRYLKEIWHHIINEHALIIPQYDIYIGEGNDILNTFHYYTIGDPLNLLSFFVKEEYIYILYDILVAVRIYLAGLAFSCFTLYKKKNISYAGLLIGALTYIFNYFIFCYATCHPYFANPMIYMPLILLGIEYIIEEDRPYIFILSVFIAAISNIYFFYMIVMFTIIYVIVRLILYRDKKETIKIFIKISLYSIIGVLIAAFILLPVLANAVSDARMGRKYLFPLIFDIHEYIHMFSSIYQLNSYNLMSASLGILSPAIFYLTYGFLIKKNNICKIFIILSAIFMCIPFFYSFFNCNSYVTIRWMFIIYLPLSYMISSAFDEQDAKNEKIALVVTFVFFILNIYANYKLEDSISFKHIIVQNVVLLMFLLFMLYKHLRSDKIKNSKIVILLFFIISACYNGFIYFNTKEYEYIDYCKTVNEIKNYYSFTNHIGEKYMSEVNDNLYRYSMNEEDGIVGRNDNMLYKKLNTQYYFTFVNTSLSRYRDKMKIADYIPWCISGYDNRLIPNILSSVKYYVKINNNKSIPTDFTYYANDDIYGKDIYENIYAIPLVYVYDTYLEEKDIEDETIVTKEEAMLKTAILDKKPNWISKYDKKFNTIKIPFAIKNIDNDVADIDEKNNKFETSKDNQSVKFIYDKIENSEIFFTLTNLRTSTDENRAIYLNDSKGHIYPMMTLAWYQPNYKERYDYVISLGDNSASDSFNTLFDKKGIYEYDDILLEAMPVDDIDVNIESLRDIKILNYDFNNKNNISFDVEVDAKKILCLSFPYSRGFRAYVDGKEQEIHKVNYKNMGIEINEGVHNIRFYYNTPYLKMGIIITIVAILGLFARILYIKNAQKYSEKHS